MTKNKQVKYDSPSVTVDVVIFTIEKNDLKILLIKRANNPYRNAWALPGGFIHKNETSLEAAKRILKDKAGIKNVYVEQLYTFDSPARDPRGHIISVTYFALVPRDNIVFDSKTAQNPDFFSVRTAPPLAFDHKNIVVYAAKRLAAKLQYTNIAFSLLPAQFTFGELQKTYEAILNAKLDKRNFRKKFLLLGLIKPTQKMFLGGKQRPAKLYQFISKKPAELKKFF